MPSSKPIASLSLDLDNQWSYMKTHGDAGWEKFPTYLPVVVPRVLEILRRDQLTITFFIVGQDAVRAENRAALASIADAGHEIGNHSFHHEPWLHLYTRDAVEHEIGAAEDAIVHATGRRPVGFRGPGFSVSPIVLSVLAERCYLYDASTFPTFLGPLARAYYFMKSKDLSREELQKRMRLFGTFAEGFRPLKPYRWQTAGGELTEIPVTTMPLFRVPVHLSYVLYLGGYSRYLALAYFRAAMLLCRLTAVVPSLLLHPLDFLGAEDVPELAFFPAMNMPKSRKLALAAQIIEMYAATFAVKTMAEHAEHISASSLPLVRVESMPVDNNLALASAAHA